jgi:hypothetical protein
MKKNTLLLFIACFLALSGCKKDREDERIEKLVGKNWKLTAATEDGDDVYTSDLDACEKDDIYKYFSNGKYQHEEGATKCSSSDDQIVETSQWKLNGDKIAFSTEGFSIEFTIVTLTNSILKYQGRFEGSDYVYTFTAQ